MKVHAVIARALADLGVETMFGVIGDANLFTVDRFVSDHGGTYVAAANEAGALLMASGYAQASGRVGVATVTHGPGLTNTVTALVEGVRARTPAVLVAGDTSAEDGENAQDIAQREVIVATGAGFEQLRSPATAAHDVAVAMRRAAAERRPVVLNVPVGLQWHDVGYRRPWMGPPERQATAPDPAALDRAVGIIATAGRPIVLAGRGAADANARRAALRLAERIGAPVATTLQARDLFRGEPFDLGVFGTLSNEVAVDTIMESDCIVAFGAGLNRWTTASGSYLAGKRVVHCDIDPGAIGRLAPVDAGLVGDAATVADTIVAWLDEAEAPATGFRSTRLSERLAGWSPADVDDTSSTEGTVDIRTALLAVEAAVPHDRTVVFDAGQFVFQALVRLHAPDPSAWVLTFGFGSIGLGMGTAIGAAHGRPGHPVLLVTGDGGFMLGGLAEFNTAVRHRLDLVVVVLNDGSYGAEHRRFRERDMDPAISTFGWPDLAPVADALGGRGLTVRAAEDLGALAQAIAGRDRDRPLLVDVKLDPALVPGPDH